MSPIFLKIYLRLTAEEGSFYSLCPQLTSKEIGGAEVTSRTHGLYNNFYVEHDMILDQARIFELLNTR